MAPEPVLREGSATLALARNHSAEDLLTQLCRDLAQLRAEAGGPSLRTLSAEIGLGKSQLGAIVTGQIRRPPDWRVVRGFVEGCYKYAYDVGREHRLSIRSSVDGYWRPRYSMVEHAFSQPRTRKSGVTPRQLPAVVPAFAGRAAQLVELSRAAGTGRPVLITGPGGVGKTALAIAWAHRSARRYPDGQLYVNLRGSDPSGRAMTPAQAVRVLLEALVPQAIPPGLEEQVGLYRRLLATRRVLVLLDNARDADQVRPLLPGDGNSRVLVTSRTELTALVAADGAYPLALDVLPADEARQFLVHWLGTDRVATEPEAVDRILDVCGRLPMALAIVAAWSATRRALPLSAAAERMTNLRTSLFAWAYESLSAPAARLFRLLSVHPGPELGAASVARLADTADTPDAGRLLAELVHANLVEEPRPGRFALHDLLRAYSMQLVHADEALLARQRLGDHYAATAYQAALLLSPLRTPVALGSLEHEGGLRSRDEAMAWFAAERLALIGVAEQATDRQLCLIAWSLADFLECRRYFEDWVALQNRAVAAARRLNDVHFLARMLLILGHGRELIGRALIGRGSESAGRGSESAGGETGLAGGEGGLAGGEAGLIGRGGELAGRGSESAGGETGLAGGEGGLAGGEAGLIGRGGELAGRGSELAGWPDDALAPLEEALKLFSDPVWRARAGIMLGGLLEKLGRYADALAHTQQSLEMCRSAGDRAGEARAENAMGWIRCQLGDFELAIEHCGRALASYEALGDVAGQAATWDSLGLAQHGLGGYDRAIDCYRRAIQLARAYGDRYNEARTLVRLGETYQAVGDPDAALEVWQQALAILDDLGHPDAADLRIRVTAATVPGDRPRTS